MPGDRSKSKADAPTVQRLVTITNRRGLHARAAAKFVKLAERFDADVTVAKAELKVSGSSIMGLMMLAAAPGCDLEITARGPAAEAALAALCKLIANGFDEED